MKRQGGLQMNVNKECVTAEGVQELWHARDEIHGGYMIVRF